VQKIQIGSVGAGLRRRIGAGITFFSGRRHRAAPNSEEDFLELGGVRNGRVARHTVEGLDKQGGFFGGVVGEDEVGVEGAKQKRA
jgi:hypothetical protein